MGYYRENETELKNQEKETDREQSDFLEELGAEATPLEKGTAHFDEKASIDKDRGEEQEGTGYGILALVLSIMAFFFLPVVMGAAGIIIGFIARSKGAGTWGAWAIGVGAAAIVINLFAAPFF